MGLSSWAIQELSRNLELENTVLVLIFITMYCTLIHYVAYKENFFIANCQATYVSIQLNDKKNYILW